MNENEGNLYEFFFYCLIFGMEIIHKRYTLYAFSIKYRFDCARKKITMNIFKLLYIYIYIFDIVFFMHIDRKLLLFFFLLLQIINSLYCVNYYDNTMKKKS